MESPPTPNFGTHLKQQSGTLDSLNVSSESESVSWTTEGEQRHPTMQRVRSRSCLNIGDDIDSCSDSPMMASEGSLHACTEGLDYKEALLNELVGCVEDLQTHVSFLFTQILPMLDMSNIAVQVCSAHFGKNPSHGKLVGGRTGALRRQASEIKQLKDAVKALSARQHATSKHILRIVGMREHGHRLPVKSKTFSANAKSYNLVQERLATSDCVQTSHKLDTSTKHAHPCQNYIPVPSGDVDLDYIKDSTWEVASQSDPDGVAPAELSTHLRSCELDVVSPPEESLDTSAVAAPYRMSQKKHPESHQEGTAEPDCDGHIDESRGVTCELSDLTALERSETTQEPPSVASGLEDEGNFARSDNAIPMEISESTCEVLVEKSKNWRSNFHPGRRRARS